jgi:hypothetical protein
VQIRYFSIKQSQRQDTAIFIYPTLLIPFSSKEEGDHMKREASPLLGIFFLANFFGIQT